MISYVKKYKLLKKREKELCMEVLSSKEQYITSTEEKNLEEVLDNFIIDIKRFPLYQIIFRQSIKYSRNFNKIVEFNNNRYINAELDYNKNLFDNVCGYPLDMNQRKAIVIDDNKNLIIAGAGSGKSLTMIGKIHYLIATKNIRESEILCISFTNEATKSLKNKLKVSYGYEIDVLTFHKLGYQIIREKYPTIKIAESNILEKIVDDYFKNLNKEQFLLILNYFNELSVFPNDYKVKSSYNTLRSLCENRNEIVGSSEEVAIANILYLNGIEYTYESTDIGCIYHLTKEKNKLYYYNFNNPFYTLDRIEKEKDKNSILISKYDKYDMGFSKKMNIICLQMKIELNLSIDKLYVDMLENENDYIVSLKKLFINFINIFKSGTKTIVELKYRVKPKSIEGIFLSIFEDIYRKYENYLEKNHKIDVNDLLQLATKITKDTYTYKNYKYIMIDEFQDTSMIRYALIQNIINHTGAKLVAVGDDFQSIYRFSGCDINLFINFEKYFGAVQKSYIENTYRNSQELIDIAGEFVMKNPRQIQKKLYSPKHIQRPIQICYYDDLATSFLELWNNLPPNKTKMILGRNNKDMDLLVGSKIQKGMTGIYINNTKEKIPFMTVHKSKGLEFDYIILIHMTDDITGFPSKIEENPILDLVLPEKEEYPYAEERRLFYVALTRAKEKVYILSPKKNKSVFVIELEEMLSK